ncbi:hypothetical protein PbJCM13498_40920 [Prolixibacter bellariivorans]|uniref:Uncharacterized protein n=1 Tax=Prolixibacter bellariivorans TaxID=314319 RepID=A0A5M4B4Y1_9BACT|nr:hypothetical protein PbJCM13498_40920 [Prolixibacter bellariivorans]
MANPFNANVWKVRLPVQQPDEESGIMTKKEGANDCHYSYNQAPQGPSQENKTMSAPL